MLKFFHKYNKIIMVVGGSILMVVFLLPAGGQMLQPDHGAQIVGSVGDEELTLGQQRTAYLELSLLRQAGQFSLNDPIQWMLLIREARQHGIYASRQQAAEELERLKRSGVPVDRVLRSSNVSEDFFVQALQHQGMVLELVGLIGGGDFPSEPRIRHFAQDYQSSASLELVGLDPDELVKDPPTPDAKKVEELFEKYKDQIAGAGKPHGFGYRLPAQVQLEYLAVPLKRVQVSIQVDEKEAYLYWLNHPERFVIAEPPAPPDPPATPETPETPKAPDAPDTPESPTKPKTGPDRDAKTGDGKKDGDCQDPAADDKSPAPAPSKQDPGKNTEAPTPPKKPLTEIERYKKVRQRVFDDLTRRKAEEKRDQIVGWILAELGRDSKASFADLAEQLGKKFAVTPDFIRDESRWHTLEAIEKLDGFGGAALQHAGRSVPVRDYIAQAEGLGAEDNTLLSSLRLAPRAASAPVTDVSGNKYIFRLLAAEAERAPASLDEVKEQVTKDARRLGAFEKLKSRQADLLEQVRKDGLEKVAEKYKSEVEKAERITGRLFSSLPAGARDKELAQAVFTLARELHKDGGLEKVGAARTFLAYAGEQSQKLYLVRLKEYEAVDQEAFDRSKTMIPYFMRSLGRSRSAENPVSMEAISRRLGYKPDRDEEEETEDGSKDDEPAGG